VAGIANPQIAYYTPRSTQSELEHAFRTRWVHGLNTQAPWNFVDEMVAKAYANFAPTPWFIGEYGGNGQPKAVIQRDLEQMDQRASDDSTFLGTAFFQFQTTYWKGGSEMNFGLFSLSSEQLGETGELCDAQNIDCHSCPVHCLSTDLAWLPGTVAHRAEAVAAAWRGSVHMNGASCGNRRLMV